MKIIKKIIKNIFSDMTSEEKSVLQALKKRPQAPYDFLMRYQKILEEAIQWEELDFKNKIVMEVGCGPHLGFGPLALYLGAKKFIAVDPTANDKIYTSEKLINNYFRMTFKDYNGIYRKKINFESFFEIIKKNTLFYNNIKDVPKNFYSGVDIQLTNSCLEHINDLQDLLSSLKALISDDGKYIHAIDFGNHMKSKNPFNGIYELSPKDFKSKFGSKINLVYPSKMIEMFSQAGFSNALLVPYYFFKEDFDQNINDYWSENLKESDFFLKVGLIAGEKVK